MRKCGIVLMFFVLTMMVTAGESTAQDVGNGELPDRTRVQEALSEGILDLAMGTERRLRWEVCGDRLHAGTTANAHAAELAGIFVSAAYDTPQGQPDVSLDPWILASIAFQESSFNRCAVGRQEVRRVVRAREAAGGDPISVRDMMRQVRSSEWRRQHDIRAMDFGLVQVRFPGVYSRGVRSPQELFEAERAVGILATNLRRSLAACRAHPWTVSEDATGVRVRPGLSCEQTYWSSHGERRRFRLSNWRSVMRHYERLAPRRAEVEETLFGG